MRVSRGDDDDAIFLAIWSPSLPLPLVNTGQQRIHNLVIYYLGNDMISARHASSPRHVAALGFTPLMVPRTLKQPVAPYTNNDG